MSHIETSSYGFWTPRRIPRGNIDNTTRCRPMRMRTSAILRPPPPSVNFQVETFKIYGKLRSTTTEVHNSLPTVETIQTEKTLLSFDEKRRVTPDGANYDDFYRTLSSSITPIPSRLGTARSAAGLSSRSVESRTNTFFHLSPNIANSLGRPLETRQSIFSRLGTGLTPRPIDSSRGTDRLSSSLSAYGRPAIGSRPPSRDTSRITENASVADGAASETSSSLCD